MFYSNLIKEYIEARASFEYPKFLYEPEIYSMKMFIFVPLAISTEHIKAVFELFIMFPEELSSEMPAFFIKNPSYDQFKPNMKHVSLGKHDQEKKAYRAIMGGVQVVLP